MTATAYGIGCYLSTGGIINIAESKTFFGLKKEDKLLGFIHVGVPKAITHSGKRKPLDEKVKWIRA